LNHAPENAAAKLQSLAGVTTVFPAPLNDAGESTLMVEAEAKTDVREAVARLCVQENWGLLEISRARTTLEDVFLELTTRDES